MADVIILAGGAGSRMGGVDKPGLVVGGQRMVDAAIAAASGHRIVVVGPHRDLQPEIRQTQETPAGSGPVSAVAAGLAELGPAAADFVYILAADLPFVTYEALAQLPSAPAEAAFAVDAAGHPQYLFGCWRATFLHERLGELATPLNQPMRALAPTLAELVHIDLVDDVDTPAHLEQAKVAAATLDLARTRAAITRGIRPVAERSCAPVDGLGGVLATDVLAREPLPRFPVSAMDGYAVNGDGPWVIRAEIGYAGGELPTELQSGEAVRIATGAMVPAGSDRVIRDEFVSVAGNVLEPRPGIETRNDIRSVGEDWPIGEQLARRGEMVSAAVVSAALSGEVTSLSVRGPIRAHVLITGDEIRGEGPLQPGQSRDSIGPVLPIYLRHIGIVQTSHAHLRDTADGFDHVLSTARVDVIVVVGATGRGAADHLRTALRRAGATILVERVTVRPGGSQLVATLPGGTVVFGLPGNPFAAIATALLTGPAIVSALLAATPRDATVASLRNADEVASTIPRIVPADYINGEWVARPGVRTAHLAGLIGAQALAVAPPDAAAGAIVELLPLPIGL